MTGAWGLDIVVCMSRKLIMPCSLSSRSARYQIGIAMALITIIPILVVAYLSGVESKAVVDSLLARPVALMLLILVSLSGYSLMSRYPVNIMRLRTYLGDMVQGKYPQEVDLLSGMEDIPAIQRSFGMLFDQMAEQVSRLEEEVKHRKEAERIKDEFVSTVSHELRTPLAIAKEGISLLVDRVPGEINEKQERILNTAAGNVDQLARIINDLLDISKIEAGKFDILRERMDLSQIAREATDSICALADRKGLRLELELPPGPMDVYADPDRIMQVLTNLLSNAVKFTQEGFVRVAVTATGDGDVECSVRDSGRGILPDDAEKVFDKFVQFGRSYGACEKGTGLGLAIVQNIVELHGGTVRVDSTLKRGTAFTLALPCYSEEGVLGSVVDERIRSAGEEDGVFGVFLMEFSSTGGLGDKVQKAFLDEETSASLRAKLHIRSEDFMTVRGDGRIALVAETGTGDIDEIRERWAANMKGWIENVAGGTEIVTAVGEARYPADGESADALLAKADEALSQNRPI